MVYSNSIFHPKGFPLHDLDGNRITPRLTFQHMDDGGIGRSYLFDSSVKFVNVEVLYQGTARWVTIPADFRVGIGRGSRPDRTSRSSGRCGSGQECPLEVLCPEGSRSGTILSRELPPCAKLESRKPLSCCFSGPWHWSGPCIVPCPPCCTGIGRFSWLAPPHPNLGLEPCGEGRSPYRHRPFPEQGGLCGIQPGFSHLPCGVLLHAPGVFPDRFVSKSPFLVPQRGGVRVPAAAFLVASALFFCAAAEAVPAATEVAAMAYHSERYRIKSHARVAPTRKTVSGATRLNR